MKSSSWTGLLSFAAAFILASCEKGQDGIPNNPGASHQDERTDTENQKGFDGRQETIIPGSRH